MVSSLDSFIASSDESTDWMHSHDFFEEGVELSDEYVSEFLSTIDCYVMGSRTYEHALQLGWVYGKTPVVVLSHRRLESHNRNVEFHAGDLADLAKTLTRKYQNIWVVGGADTVKQFLLSNLVDEIVLTIVPVILGSGKPFFDDLGKTFQLHLKKTEAFKDGMVELTYQVRK